MATLTYSLDNALILHSYEIHQQAQECTKKGMYSEALKLLKEVLEIRTKYQHIPPYICAVDIATIHSEIGKVLLLMSLYYDACPHFHSAWQYYLRLFGSNHPLTDEALTLWNQARNQARGIHYIKSSSGAAAA